MGQGQNGKDRILFGSCWGVKQGGLKFTLHNICPSANMSNIIMLLNINLFLIFAVMETRLINNNYSVREDGLITNIVTGRVLAQSNNIVKKVKSGYMYVTLISKDPITGKNILNRTPVHRLVAKAFIPNPDNKPWVNHKDKVRGNNHVSNLEWSSISENIQHSYDTGRVKPIGMKGKLHKDSTKALMKAAKIGVKHPKFKHIYIVDGLVFFSTYEAERVTGIHKSTIRGRCLSDKFQFRKYFIISCLD